MEKIIKTLIIGNGYWGNILKKNIEKIDKYYLIGIASKDNIEEYLLNYYDLIWIATPNSTHFEIIKKISAFTNYIVCEKPLFIDQNQLEEFKKINLKIKLFTNFIYCYDPRIIDLKNKLKTLHAYNKIELIMKQNGKKHDNVINILVSHCLSIIFFLFGKFSFDEINIKNYDKNSINISFKTKNCTIRILCDNNSNDEKERQIKLSDNNLLKIVDFSQNIEGINAPINNLLIDLVEKIPASKDNIMTSIIVNSLLIKLNNLAYKI